MHRPRFIRFQHIALCILMLFAPLIAYSQSEPSPLQVYITMHTAPIDDYCAPCIASEKLLKEANLEFRKILEPLGPWPWFTFTDALGNQSTVHGGLQRDDIERIKKGELPKNR
jgi:hypothetical protein